MTAGSDSTCSIGGDSMHAELLHIADRQTCMYTHMWRGNSYNSMHSHVLFYISLWKYFKDIECRLVILSGSTLH